MTLIEKFGLIGDIAQLLAISGLSILLFSLIRETNKLRNQVAELDDEMEEVWNFVDPEPEIECVNLKQATIDEVAEALDAWEKVLNGETEEKR